MAVTHTQTSHHVRNYVVGVYKDTGTAAAFDITTGFKPRYVRVVNLDDREQVEWFTGMSDANALKTVAAGTVTKITTLGITPKDKGFTVGVDTDVNVANKDLFYLAIG